MNLETPKIRRADARDVQVLSVVGRRSFDEAFSDHPANHPDDMRAYMDEAFAEATIAAEIANAQTIFLIAETGNEAAGYLKMKFDAREPCVSGERPLELCRLYALDKFIGRGVGRALMLEFLKIAAETNRDTLWLGVWEFNYRAQAFYRKFGFEKCGEHVFQLGSDPQTDWIFEKRI
ncbi:MAG: GNAT family N-acetyltransferase [Acidobacteria bacterium]|nr:GNAT family N-acetyltransferase [Acidobacteriota bacterium]